MWVYKKLFKYITYYKRKGFFMKTKLVIDDNTLYEIDMDCVEKKQRKGKPAVSDCFDKKKSSQEKNEKR